MECSNPAASNYLVLCPFFSPMPSESWKHRHCMLMMHVWAELQDRLCSPRNANRLYFLFCFVCLWFCTPPPTPLPYSLSLGSNPYWEHFIFFFSLPFFCFRGVNKGLRNCSENFHISLFMLRGTAKYKSLKEKGKQRRRERGSQRYCTKGKRGGTNGVSARTFYSITMKALWFS